MPFSNADFQIGDLFAAVPYIANSIFPDEFAERLKFGLA
jgi:hypothetical protein